jgi:enoyl-CoA hydratase/carnithine racemase
MGLKERKIMAEPAVLRSEREGILELVLNRPEKLNALNQETLDTIRAAVEDLRLRDDLRVMLIRATGRYFSAGADLTAFNDNPTDKSGLKTRSWFRREMGGMQTLWQEMELVEKPIVAAHQAMCVGGGLEMSLSCDFRLAAASAGYWFPEMKMAMVPASGGISRLTRICGLHWAKWMVLANQKVDAQRALTMGLVHEVYPDETFEEEVWAFCRLLASYPPEVTAIAKMSIEMAADLDSANARQLERLVYSNLMSGDEQAAMRKQHHQNILKS